MRIIPFELYPYASEISLKALRKEFGIYDYYLNICSQNKAMQPFLDMGRSYFLLSFLKWVQEMKKRNYYLNSFHLFYFENNIYHDVSTKTNFFLILECCIQWELKNFIPFDGILSWYNIFLNISYISDNIRPILEYSIYQHLLKWYQTNFMKKNKKGQIKPYKLDMIRVIQYFETIINK